MNDNGSSIYAALEAFKSSDMKRYTRAKCFLGADWKTLKSERDFAAAYDGYQCCVGLLPKEHHATLKEMRQGLNDYVKARSQVTPDEWLQISEEALNKILDLLKTHLNIEVWNKVGSIVKGIFEQISKGGNS